MKTIHWHACRGNSAGVFEEIVIKGINVNLKNEKGNKTPLHYASSNGHPKVVKLLLEHNADIYTQDEHLNTPIFTAVARAGELTSEEKLSDYFLVFRLLLQHEANLRRINPQAYHQIPLLKDIKDNLDYSPLTWAMRYPHIYSQLLEIIVQVEQEQNEIALQEEASRNIQPPARLMPDNIPSESSAHLRHQPVARAAEEKSTDAAQPVNTDSHVKIDLSPRSWWNSVMAFLSSEKTKDEVQQPLLSERKVNPDSPTTPKHIKVQ